MSKVYFDPSYKAWCLVGVEINLAIVAHDVLALKMFAQRNMAWKGLELSSW